MKRFAAVSLAVLMLLTVFASAASAQDVIEVRSSVFNGTDIDDIIDTYGDGTTLSIDASRFPIFYYDIDDNVSTEIVFIVDVPGTENNVIGEGGLIYVTQIQPIRYEYENPAAGWDNYSMIGFGAQKVIPLKPDKADKLAWLVLDSDAKYTLRTGETLDLGHGYTLEAKQVDVNGEKVWLQFNRNGEYVDDEIISVGTDGNTTGRTWDVELDDIEDEDDVVVLRVHVNQVFQGAADSIAQIEGLWLIDYANARTIESDDEFGELDDVSILGDTLMVTNKDTITLTRDSTDKILENVSFKTADTSSDVLRFYIMREIKYPGVHVIGGAASFGTGNFTWDASNFAGFFYDLDDNVETESLSVSNIDRNVIPEGGLVYETRIENVSYEYDNVDAGWDKYPILGFFAQKYIPLKPDKADKLARLVLDSDDKYTLRTGELLDLGEGYSIEARQVDVDGEKVWLEFTRDGEFVDDEIISVATGANTWEVELDDIQDEDDVVVLRIHVNQVFQGAADSIAQIEGLWLIDYANARTIESDDEFGKLDDVSVEGDTLTISNDNIFTLSMGSEEEIAEGMFFKIGDTPVNELRYFPFVVRILGEINETAGLPEENETEVGENVTETPSENVTEEPTEEATEEATEEETADNNATGGEEGAPGFGVVPGLVGLLAVVYLFRRKN
ncbi:PGF-CTERM sorting domain-containing protein [Methanosarcina sp. KYL-1]|uniref:S-layer protein domain-containing protein n=1 Tax=Methanosarcina sp. KYL-1 TaxID=2602068 RepID=UPI00210177ED|nr:S-layer protein domain-containing protein [Methanosarcina sp. KYL-1]MCQ1534976.1 PGF-CTERM sorting domain-containing protein [Methanosarcina sp. KYL-1]